MKPSRAGPGHPPGDANTLLQGARAEYRRHRHAAAWRDL